MPYHYKFTVIVPARNAAKYMDNASILSEKNPSLSALVALRMKYADRLSVEEIDGNILIGNADNPERLAVSGLPLSLDSLFGAEIQAAMFTAKVCRNAAQTGCLNRRSPTACSPLRTSGL